MDNLLNLFGEGQVNRDSLSFHVLLCLVQNTKHKPSEGAGGITLPLCLADVVVGECGPLIRCDGAGRRERNAR